jgi:hypothetical protein
MPGVGKGQIAAGRTDARVEGVGAEGAEAVLTWAEGFFSGMTVLATGFLAATAVLAAGFLVATAVLAAGFLVATAVLAAGFLAAGLAFCTAAISTSFGNQSSRKYNTNNYYLPQYTPNTA